MPHNFYDFMDTDFFFDFADQADSKMAPLHYHNLFEIYYLTKGTCQYFIDDRIYTLEAGDVIVIPNDVIHKVIYDQPAHSRILINFERSYIQKSLQPLLSTMTYIARVPRLQKVLENIFQKIKGEYEHPDAFSKECIKCYVAELLLTLARAQNGKTKISFESNNFVEQAISYVQQNYMNKLTLAEVARVCAVSMEHLSRTFKKKTGAGFSEYLTLYRLKCAEEMLFYYPDLSISEIAYKCGFNDGNYFSVVYKRWYGVSPSKLNRLDRESNPKSNPRLQLDFHSESKV